MDMGSPTLTLTTSCGQALKREVDDLQKGRLPIQRSRCPKVFAKGCVQGKFPFEDLSSFVHFC